MEDEGEPVAHHADDGVPDNNSNQNSYGGSIIPPCTNPKKRLTTQAESGSLLCLVFDSEMAVLSRSKKDIIDLASIMMEHEGIKTKDTSFHTLVNP